MQDTLERVGGRVGKAIARGVECTDRAEEISAREMSGRSLSVHEVERIDLPDNQLSG